eukprot:232937-Pleurochrysis_carterae.AAC.2
MGPSGRGVSLRAAASRASRGNAGRSRPRRFLLGGPAGWMSTSSSGMGSRLREAAGVGARFRKDANAGGVARAPSMHARTYAERRGPSATRPPSTSIGAPTPGRGAQLPRAADAASMSATTAFITGGYAAAAFTRERPLASRPCATEA